MKSKITLFVCTPILLSLVVLLFVSNGRLYGQRTQTGTPEFARQRIEILRQTAKTLHDLAREPLPPNLPPSEQNEANRFSLWLKNASQRCYDLANRWQAALDSILRGRTNGLQRQVRSMAEMNMSFNLQYLDLQNKISHECRQFAMVTNIMKNKHDTAKNSINNIR